MVFSAVLENNVLNTKTLNCEARMAISGRKPIRQVCCYMKITQENEDDFLSYGQIYVLILKQV